MSEAAEAVTVPEWTLGDRMRKARERAGVSIQEIADELTRNRNTIGNWEAGRHAPSDAVIRRWALRFRTPFTWLKTGIEAAPDNDPEQASSRTTCIGDGIAPVIYLQRDRAASVIADHGKAA